MNESKMPNVVVGLISSWTAWALSASLWVGTHIGQIAFGFTIMASIFTIRASIEDRRYKRVKRKVFEEIERSQKL